MITQIKMLHAILKKSYYYQEFKELSTLAAIGLAGVFLYQYGSQVFHWLTTRTGLAYLVFGMAGLVTGISIKIYYRLMEIKYYGKNTRIKLFENTDA